MVVIESLPLIHLEIIKYGDPKRKGGTGVRHALAIVSPNGHYPLLLGEGSLRDVRGMMDEFLGDLPDSMIHTLELLGREAGELKRPQA